MDISRYAIPVVISASLVKKVLSVTKDWLVLPENISDIAAIFHPKESHRMVKLKLSSAAFLERFSPGESSELTIASHSPKLDHQNGS